MRQHFQPDAPHSLRDLIESTLARHSMLSGRTILIDLADSEIVLKGVVRSYYQKQVAQESVRSMDGTRSIRNEIEVMSIG